MIHTMCKCDTDSSWMGTGSDNNIKTFELMSHGTIHILTGDLRTSASITTNQLFNHKAIKLPCWHFLLHTWGVCCFCCCFTQLDCADPSWLKTPAFILSVTNLLAQRKTFEPKSDQTALHIRWDISSFTNDNKINNKLIKIKHTNWQTKTYLA